MAAPSSLVALAERVGINTMVGLINEDAKNNLDIESFQAKLYYDQMMLEKIKIGQENYVYLKYAKKHTLPKGHKIWTIRRNFPLTEHTIPLLEGIPPRSDKMKKERIEGTFHQYGRYMEFTDRIEWKLLDPVVMEYAEEYGDVATRTMHRLARKELLNSAIQVFANNRHNVGELVIGDTLGIADFRLAGLKMARLVVRPIGSVFVVITSEEHYWDLMKDPLIVQYLGSSQGLPHYATGTLPELFNIRFEKTMLDEFAYGYELGNTGEWKDGSSVKCRIYASNPHYTGVVGTDPFIYANVDASTFRKTYVAEEYKSATAFDTKWNFRSEEEGLGDLSTEQNASEIYNRLSDGSWIPIRTVWNLSSAAIFGATPITVALTVDQAVETQLGVSDIYYKYVAATGVFTLYHKHGVAYATLGTVTTSGVDKGKLTAAQMNSVLPEFRQLPVHQAIMLGADALAQIEVTGEGNVQMFVKRKGSAGVLDPIDQRQSIGFKMNTIGFKLVRDEACWVFHHVPTQAIATAGISFVEPSALGRLGIY